ncbi:MAG: ATP-binding cassette domain-containing protein, partial [Spirochaetaceae bacterium]
MINKDHVSAEHTDKVPIVSVQNLGVSFGNIQALSGISLSLYRGEIVALLGDNGAGKTTVVKTLSG